MLARVVQFEEVDPARIDENIASVESQVRSAEPPEGLEGVRSVMMLVSRESRSVLAITLFEDEDALRRGDEALDAMTPGEGAGRRTSKEFYEVAIRHDR